MGMTKSPTPRQEFRKRAKLRVAAVLLACAAGLAAGAGERLLLASCNNAGVQLVLPNTINPQFQVEVDCTDPYVPYTTWNCTQSYIVSPMIYAKCWGADAGYSCVLNGFVQGSLIFGGSCNLGMVGGCNPANKVAPAQVPNYSLQKCVGG